MSTGLILPTGSTELGRLQVAGELLERAHAERGELAALPQREQVLLAAWLASLRSRRTRRAYSGDLLSWLAWLGEREVDVLSAGRVHVDLWVREQEAVGAAASTVCRRLSALSSFYRYAAAHDLVDVVPTAGVARPAVDRDHTATIGLDREQTRALLAAADADTGPQRLRTAAIVRLLVHNAIRTDELTAADVDALSQDRGHRVLTIVRKGGRRVKIPLAPSTWEALETYLEDRAAAAGLDGWRRLSGPLVATASGGRLRQNHLWELVRRLARTAGIDVWDQLSAHSLRHTAITLALDAGANIRDVQDWAGHRDPRTTRRYDHSRGSLDRSPAYTLASYLA
ncbi:tyrosine-type recombinase/integrase [Saccharomonospora sp. CUA-673]|uniref:tyrosine-type recombinase/integrase n=1 Tax=Saccharomonospora sp. CUA-673 TaxID=1904969 RepID=UPI0013016458|nr:tyrosine-type recombinase/integrase [Saccharomonospora sp. CUA-673]